MDAACKLFLGCYLSLYPQEDIDAIGDLARQMRSSSTLRDIQHEALVGQYGDAMATLLQKNRSLLRSLCETTASASASAPAIGDVVMVRTGKDSVEPAEVIGKGGRQGQLHVAWLVRVSEVTREDTGGGGVLVDYGTGRPLDPESYVLSSSMQDEDEPVTMDMIEEGLAVPPKTDLTRRYVYELGGVIPGKAGDMGAEEMEQLNERLGRVSRAMRSLMYNEPHSLNKRLSAALDALSAAGMTRHPEKNRLLQALPAIVEGDAARGVCVWCNLDRVLSYFSADQTMGLGRHCYAKYEQFRRLRRLREQIRAGPLHRHTETSILRAIEEAEEVAAVSYESTKRRLVRVRRVAEDEDEDEDEFAL
jgi:hypothetical protein